MIAIPVCFKCKYLEKGMKCKFYSIWIPVEITLENKEPKTVCKDFCMKERKTTTSQ